MSSRTVLLVGLFGLALAGCDSAGDPPPQLQGRFTGTLSDDGRVLDGVYNFSFFFVNSPVTLSLR